MAENDQPPGQDVNTSLNKNNKSHFFFHWAHSPCAWLTKGHVNCGWAERRCVHQQPVVTDKPTLVSVCQSTATKLWIISPFMSLHTLHSLTFSWPKGQESVNPCLADTLQLRSYPVFPRPVCLPPKITFVLICLFCPDRLRQVRVIQIWSKRRNESPPTLWQTTLWLNSISVVLAVLQPLLFWRPSLLFRLVAGTHGARRASFI